MKKIRLLRYLVNFILLLLIFVLQANALHGISIRGIVPNIIVITIVSYSLLRGSIEGAIMGAGLGLLQDIFYGEVVGFYGILFMYMGYLVGYLYNNFYKESVLIPMVVIVLSDLAQNLIVYFFTFLFRGRTQLGHYFSQIIIPELIYTALFGFLLYRLLYLINRAVEHIEWLKENEE